MLNRFHPLQTTQIHPRQSVAKAIHFNQFRPPQPPHHPFDIDSIEMGKYVQHYVIVYHFYFRNIFLPPKVCHRQVLMHSRHHQNHRHLHRQNHPRHWHCFRVVCSKKSIWRYLFCDLQNGRDRIWNDEQQHSTATHETSPQRIYISAGIVDQLVKIQVDGLSHIAHKGWVVISTVARRWNH